GWLARREDEPRRGVIALVGWAKAQAMLFNRQSLSCAVPTRGGAPRIDADGGHGVRESFIHVESSASAFAHPTMPNPLQRPRPFPRARHSAAGLACAH